MCIDKEQCLVLPEGINLEVMGWQQKGKSENHFLNINIHLGSSKNIVVSTKMICKRFKLYFRAVSRFKPRCNSNQELQLFKVTSLFSSDPDANTLATRKTPVMF